MNDVYVRGEQREMHWELLDVSELAEQPVEFRMKLRTFALILWSLPMLVVAAMVIFNVFFSMGLSWDSVVTSLATITLGFASASIVIIPYMALSSWLINILLDSDRAARILWSLRQYLLVPFGKADTVQYAVWRCEDRTVPVEISLVSDSQGTSLKLQRHDDEIYVHSSEIYTEKPKNTRIDDPDVPIRRIGLHRQTSVHITKPPGGPATDEADDTIHLSLRDGPSTSAERAVLSLSASSWLSEKGHEQLPLFVQSAVITLDEDAQRALIPTLYEVLDAVDATTATRLTKRASAVQYASKRV